MAVYYPTMVSCPCGNKFSANLARSINAGRTPAIREKIIRGDFHRVVCPKCGESKAAESPFFYTDLSRHAIYQVRPRSERLNFRHDSTRLAKAASDVPADLASSDPRQLRMIYGLDELREKLVAQDAGFDDRTVELLKIFVLQEHPFLLKKARLLIHLLSVDNAFVDFVAYYHHGTEQFKVGLPRAATDDILARENELRTWVSKAHSEDFYSTKDHWVNFRRWSSRYDALDALRALTKQVEDKKKPKLTSAGFKKMIERLPRANELPPWAKRDLRTLYDYAKANGYKDAEDKLFEVRFGFELENEWSQNEDPDDIDTIWQLLRDLPRSNVEGNSKIVKLLLEGGEGGGWYGNDTIGIGEDELTDRERFEDVLRHEVGHAVHEQRDALVTPWLEKQFGWRLLPNNAAGIDQWVKLMGGWGALSAQQRSDVVQFLRQAVGPGESWNAGPRPNPPGNHPWWGKNFAPRLAYEKTGQKNWFENYETWHRVGKKAFALNYWYAGFMVVDTAALNLVTKMPDNYAAMSLYEFFAEMYALYYDYDDPKRKAVPAAVRKWLDENIGKREPANPRKPAARRKPGRLVLAHRN